MIRLSEREESVHAFAYLGKMIWFATDSGIFRISDVSDGLLPDLVTETQATATVLAEVNGEIWVGTVEGVFLIKDHKLQPLLTDEKLQHPLRITAILSTEAAVWLGSDSGLYRLADGSLTLVVPQMIRALRKIDDTLWVGAQSNAFLILGDRDPVGVLPPEYSWPVSSIVEAGGAIWLTTIPGNRINGPCFRVSNGPLEAVGKEVISVAEIRGEVWLGTTHGAFRFRPDGKLVGPVGGINKSINTLADFRHRVWLGTALDGAFTSLDGQVFEGLTEGIQMPVRGIYEEGGHIWLRADTGPYRFDQDVDLVVHLRSTVSLPFIDRQVLVGDKIRINVAYERHGSDAYGDQLASRPRGIIRFDQQALETAHLDEYQPVEKLAEQASRGFNEVHIRVRDSFGNVVTVQPPQLVLVLGLSVVQTLLGLLVAITTILALFFHPLTRQLSGEPAALRTLSPSELATARRLLSLTGRLPSVLAAAKVERFWLNTAIKFFSTSEELLRFQLLAARLGLKPPIPDGDFQILLLGDNSFPLNVDRCYVYQPPQDRPVADILSQLRSCREIILIVSANTAVQDELHRRIARDRTNLLVAPSGTELTQLLLAQDPMEVLSRIIATQVALVRVSPYPTGGGVHKETVFFGRDEMLAHILSREGGNYFAVGGRQLGKSSLLKAIKRRSVNDPNLDAYYLVLADADLVGSLGHTLGVGSSAGIDRVLSELSQRSRRTLILIDEADDFAHSEASKEVLARLRSLSEEGVCHFILAGFWELYEAVVLDYHSPLRNFGEILHVGALEEDACYRLAIEPMASMGLHYENDKDALHLVQETGQRANLIALTCNEIVKGLSADQRRISLAMVDAALASKTIGEALDGWEDLSVVDQDNRIDRLIVYTTIERASFTLTDVLEDFSSHGLQVEPSRIKRALMRLDLAYVLKATGTKYTYPVPLFVDRVREQDVSALLAAEIRAWKAICM